MNIGITGSRFYRLDCQSQDLEFKLSNEEIKNILNDLKVKFDLSSMCFIHGGALGVDTCFETYAKQNNIQTIIKRPEYKKGKDAETKEFNRYAPLLANQEIVNLSDVLIAIKSHENSKGVNDTINKAKQKQIPVFEYLIKRF